MFSIGVDDVVLFHSLGSMGRVIVNWLATNFREDLASISLEDFSAFLAKNRVTEPMPRLLGLFERCGVLSKSMFSPYPGVKYQDTWFISAQVLDFEAQLAQRTNDDRTWVADAFHEQEVRRATGSLLKLMTDGVSDERIKKATRVLTDETLSVGEKLKELDSLIPISSTATSGQLGDVFGVTKQAILKTEWWNLNRKRRQDREAERHQAVVRASVEGAKHRVRHEAD